MTIADNARNQAISLEAKKDALSQRQSGDWKVSFTVQGIDMDARLTQAPMGTRYAMVLVEIGDDELPVVGAVARTAGRSIAFGKRAEQGNQGGRHALAPDDSNEHREKTSADEPTPQRPSRERMDWREVQPAAQAGIRSTDPIFIAFLKEEYPSFWREEGESAACIRAICDVNSRSEFSTNHVKRVLWHQLDSQFQAWQAKERVGA